MIGLKLRGSLYAVVMMDLDLLFLNWKQQILKANRYYILVDFNPGLYIVLPEFTYCFNSNSPSFASMLP